jgi:serine/threonine protein kinase/tetratricopeptide (TPR) repeat protein
MGEVYRARDPRLDRDVAIKVLPERLARDGQALARFMREAKAVAALSHPNILAIFDLGTEDGTVYAVAELLEGETLLARLARGPLPWKKAAEFGIAIAEGLAAAHSKTIVHRDLKPANLFVTADGRIKILDFGVARVEDASANDETRTDEGKVVGTVGYMAPEQVRGLTAGPSADLFALGCVLYEMLAGRRAFHAETSSDTMVAILRESPKDLVALGIEVPIELQRVIHHCLEKNAEERFQSARDLAFDLKACLNIASSRAVTPVQAPVATNSIAVLPFTCASGEPDGVYLSEGITESIINSLAQISQLRVTPRSTVFRYRGKEELDPQAVGRELSVRVVLTGRVALRGPALLVSAELMDVTEGTQLWGERYNSKIEDIFELEEQVARKISERLRVKLTGEADRRMAKRFTENTEAYQLYLKGRHHWTRRTPAALQQAITYFQQAIDKDPSYALAYAGLSDCYSLFGIYCIAPGVQAWANANASATAAIGLDPELAEGYSALAFSRAYGSWDWAGAEAHFRRAAELNPGYWVTPYWYSVLLASLNRPAEAQAQVRLARELEPLSPVVLHAAAWAAIVAGCPDEAKRHCREGIAIDSSFPLLHVWHGLAHEMCGDYADAIPEYESAVRVSPGIAWIAAFAGHAYGRAGRTGDAERVLHDLQHPAGGRPVDPYAVALVQLGCGNRDAALDGLEEFCANRNGFGVVVINVDPRLAPIAADPRYRAVLRRMGF